MFSHATTQAARSVLYLQNPLVFFRIDPDIGNDRHQVLEPKRFEYAMEIGRSQFPCQIGVIEGGQSERTEP